MSKKSWTAPSVKSSLSIKKTLGDTGGGSDMGQGTGSTDNNPNNPNKIIS